MSTKKNKNHCIKVDRFRGICPDAPKGGTFVADDIQNFRINADGSLEKRWGMKPIYHSQNSIDASIVVRSEQSPGIYLLQNYTVIYFDLKSGTRSACGYVEPKTETAHFFYYQGILYLLCDESLYIVEKNLIRRTIGYIPLIGKDWPNNVVGEIYEPRNLLNNSGRIDYVIGDPPSVFLHAPYPIKSVHTVIRNGIKLEQDQYELDKTFNTINVYDAQAGDRISVYMVFEDDETRNTSALYRCHHSLSYGSSDHGRLFLFGDVLPSTIFCVKPVSEESLRASQAANSISSAPYFPEGCERRIGHGEFKIQHATVDRDHVLIFTTGNTWVAKNTGDDSELLSANGVYPIGCASSNGVITVGDLPISVGSNTIYQWKSMANGNLQPVSISKSIDPFVDKEFYERAQLYHDPSRNELWVNDPQKKTVWIYNLDSDTWVRYTSIPSSRLIWLYDRMGVINEGAIYAFDPDCKDDIQSDGTAVPIRATYSASMGDLGVPALKTISHIVLHGFFEGSPLEVLIYSENLYDSIYVKVGESAVKTYSVIRKRCPSGRFTNANIFLDADAGSFPVIQSLAIHTK